MVCIHTNQQQKTSAARSRISSKFTFSSPLQAVSNNTSIARTYYGHIDTTLIRNIATVSHINIQSKPSLHFGSERYEVYVYTSFLPGRA